MCLVISIWYDILYEINTSSKLLQSPSLDLSEAINQLNITKKLLAMVVAMATFVPCTAHSLNLAGVNAASSNV